MEVDNACIALIDEDQQDAVKALFECTTELYCYIVDKVCEIYGDNITGLQCTTIGDAARTVLLL
jgi:hypothetical protein